MHVVVGIVVLGLGALIVYLMWPRNPDHVLFVGDSVTFLSWQAIDDRFGADTDLEAVARPGFRSVDLLPLAQEAMDDRAEAGHPLDRAIFLVGYNDVWQDELDRNELPALVALSARHECAIWLTIPARPGGDPPAADDFDPEQADALNEELTDLVGEHRNVHLVTEWAEAIDGASDPDIYLTEDGIHPNEEGQKLLARIMHDHIVSACRFP